MVCYYTNWSVYRPGTAKFNPQNINPYLCTHLVYAFGGFTKDNQMKPFDKYQDIEQGEWARHAPSFRRVNFTRLQFPVLFLFLFLLPLLSINAPV